MFGSVSLTFECSQLVFSFLLTPENNFLFCNIDISLIYHTEMCKKLLYPYSQTSKDISNEQSEIWMGCLSLGWDICLGEGRWVSAFLQSRLGR